MFSITEGVDTSRLVGQQSAAPQTATSHHYFKYYYYSTYINTKESKDLTQP